MVTCKGEGSRVGGKGQKRETFKGIYYHLYIYCIHIYSI